MSLFSRILVSSHAELYCGKPPISDIINVVSVQGRSYFYRDEVRFQCRPGIQPVRSPPIITCTETGQWDGKIACHCMY